MNWTLVAIGALLICVLIQILRLQTWRDKLPRSTKHDLLLGKHPSSRRERDFAELYGYYGIGAVRFIGIILVIVCAALALRYIGFL